MNPRDQFIKDFVQAGKAKGASKDEVATKLDSALKEYDAQIQPQQGHPLRQVSEFLRSFGLGYVPDELGTLQFGAQTALHLGKETPDDLNKIADQNLFLSPDQLKKTGGSVGDITNKTARDTAGVASWLIAPEAAGVKQFIAKNAVAGALGAASQDDADAGDIARGGVFGVAAPAILRGASSVIKGAIENAAKPVGQKLEETGKNLVLRGLKINASQIEKFEGKAKEPIEKFMDRYNLTDDFVNRTNQAIDEVQDHYDDFSINSKSTVTRKQFSEAFQSKINQMKAASVPAVKKKAKELEQLRANFLKGKGKEIPISELTKWRRTEIDPLLKDGQFSMSPLEKNYLTHAREAVTGLMYDAAEKSGGDLRSLGQELKKLYTFQKIAKKQSGLGRGTSPIPLTNSNFGIISAILSGGNPLTTLAGAAAPTVLRNPKVIKAEGQAMKGVGKGLQGLDPNIAERLNALQRLYRQSAATTAGRQ